jgi:hypothetical protein
MNVEGPVAYIIFAVVEMGILNIIEFMNRVVTQVYFIPKKMIEMMKMWSHADLREIQ